MSLQRPLEPFEKVITIAEAPALVGKWFALLPGHDPVILIRVSRAGEALLIRHAGNPKRRGTSSHYAWANVDSLIRREDWDARPHPEWLQHALASPRPAFDLRDVINAIKAPEYTEHALEMRSVGEIAQRGLDELTYRSYAHNRLLAPARPVEDWRHIFPDVDELEARFQGELSRLNVNGGR